LTINLSSFKKKLLGDGVWVFSGQVGVGVVTLAGVRLLTEFVPPKVYGNVALVTGIAVLFNGFLCAPFLQAAYRFYSEAVCTGNISVLRRTIYGLLMKSVTALVVTILLGGIIYCSLKDAPYIVVLVLASLLVVEIYRQLELSLLGAARRQRAVAIWQTSEALCRPAFAILVVVLIGATSQSVLLGYLAATGGILLCVHLLPFKLEGTGNSNATGKVDEHMKKEIRRYALPLMPLALVAWVSSLSDRYIIGIILGSEQVGIYSAAYGLIHKSVLMGCGIITLTLLPVYNNAVSEQNNYVAEKVFRMWLLITTTITAISVIGVFFFNKWIAFLLLAEQYRSSAVLMPWFAAGFAGYALACVFEGYLYAHKHTKVLVLGHSIVAVTSIAVTIPLVIFWKLKGAAIACTIYFFIHLIVMVCLTQYLKRKVRNKQSNKPQITWV
jgi:O-antigen/teichoic acid export membrane protein